MITPMVKYQFLVYYRETEDLLALLKRSGVLHIKRMKREVDEAALSVRREWLSLRALQQHVERVLPEREIEDSAILDAFRLEELPALLQELDDLDRDLRRLVEDRFHYRFFGTYDADKMTALKARGLYLHLFSVGLGKIQAAWSQDYALEPLFETGRKSFFVVVSDLAIPPAIKAQQEAFPARSLNELDLEIQSMEDRRRIIRQTMFALQDNIRRHLAAEMARLQDSLQDGSARAQMLHLGAGKVVALQGFLPEDQQAHLDTALATSDVFYVKSRPVPSDAPPILLRNPATASLFEPIARLFDLPRYAELDLTPFFTPFFLLFFGLCLGDAGYGLLVLVVLLALRRKVPLEYRPLWKLALVLEGAAVVMGALSGTFFGINLLEVSVPWLRPVQNYMFNSDQLFNLALGLGAVQILFGLILRAWNQKKQYGMVYALSPIGWIALLAGLGGGAGFGFSPVFLVLCGLGVGLVLFFSDPAAGLLGRLGKGLWDLYGITGYFGDLLSYIRLFALGLAGSILGFVVNDISLSILGSHAILGPIFFVVMLLIGHSLNILIASLGAFVHPMRLTFVEFYKNAGFQGGGEPYQPLQELVQAAENHPSIRPAQPSVMPSSIPSAQPSVMPSSIPSAQPSAIQPSNTSPHPSPIPPSIPPSITSRIPFSDTRLAR